MGCPWIRLAKCWDTGEAALDGPYKGVLELSNRLASSPRVERCLATNWYRYAMGRVETAADGCSLREVEQEVSRGRHVMNRVRKDTELSRRHFLRAAGGAAVALPLLSSLRAGAAGENFPKRLVLMYAPNGVIPDSWWPLNVTSETSWDLNTIHKPLLPFKDRLNFLAGVNLTVTNDGPGWPTPKGHRRTVHRPAAAKWRAVRRWAAVSARAGPMVSASIQEIAKTVAVGTPITSLELGVRATENDVQGRIAYAGPGAPLRP